MDVDAGAADAGGVMDAAVSLMDGQVACESDAECDDGLFCNGAETCADAVCQAGAPPACDDGIACTVDACSESAGACTSAAPDSDGDGVGDASCRDADGLALGTDCDDADPNRYPDNPEVCDAEERDEDCNPLTIGARDDDGDGHISDQCCNVDPDGVRVCGDDCMDDGEPFVHRGAFELCDGLDNDCNGLTDDDIRSRTFGVDCDGDRFGVATDPPIIDCALPTLAVPCEGGTWVPDATDCDDTSASRNPGLTEVCDGLDNNCDPEGAVDEGVVSVDYYPDCDGDSHGDASVAPRTECTFPGTPPACDGGGWATTPTDCDDADPRRHVGRSEICDGIDNDCDPMNLPDDGLPFFDYYPDCDLDSYGDALAAANRSCMFPVSPPSCGGAWVMRQGDCDDTEFARNPGRIEICDGLDNDCDPANLVDDGLTFLDYYPDCDADGYGEDGVSPINVCDFPTAAPSCAGGVWANRAGDCDDTDATRNPGRVEECDGQDNNCDPAEAVDEGLPAATYYADCDGDRFGRIGASVTDCRAPVTRPGACASTGVWATNASDCDDTDGTRSPAAPEVCNGVDTDCNALVDDLIGGTEVCSPGDSQSCLTSCLTPGTQGCSGCVGWDACSGTEICNGCDDDASGAPEGPADGFACAALVSTESCTVPVCGTTGTRSCSETCAWESCQATEVCNYCDDNASGDFHEERVMATRNAREPIQDCAISHAIGATFCDWVSGDMNAHLLDGTSMNQTGGFWWSPSNWVQGWGRTDFEVAIRLTRVAGSGGDVEQPMGGWSILLATSGSGTLGTAQNGGVPSSFSGLSVTRFWSNRTGGDCAPAGTVPDEGDVLRVTHDGDWRVVGGGSTAPCGDGEILTGTAGDFDAASTTRTQRLRLTYVPDDPSTPSTNEEAISVVANGVTMIYRGTDTGTHAPNGDIPIGSSPLRIGITAGVFSETGFGATPTDVYGVPVQAEVNIWTSPSGPPEPTIYIERDSVCP